LTSQVDGDELHIGIHWRSGATEQIITRRPPPPHEARRTPSDATKLIMQLGPTLTDEELVAQLNGAGLTTGLGRPFDVAAIQWVRYTRHVPLPSPFHAGELSVDEVAAQLHVSSGAVYYWIEHGQLAARRGRNGRWCVAYTPEVEAACRQRVLGSHHIKPESRTALVGEAV
jgi:hypothetical protein